MAKIGKYLVKNGARKIVGLLCASAIANAQAIFTSLGKEYFHTIDRIEIQNGRLFSKVHTSSKPYNRGHLVYELDSVDVRGSNDRFNANYLWADNWEFVHDSLQTVSNKSFLRHLYRKKGAFTSVSTQGLRLTLNPLYHLEQRNNNIQDLYSLHSRGLEVRGILGEKIGFYSMVTANQAYFPDYVRSRIDSTRAIPGEDFWKRYEANGYDYYSSRGYIAFNPIRQVTLQFGHDKNQIGNGYRSIILSDFAPRYLFGKINTQVWKIHYANIFADMTGRVLNNNNINPRKYVAMHHLSYNVTKRLNIGFFESVVFGRGDTASNGSYGFELNYLNPLIFYRSVESYMGSKDKMTVAADFKYNFARHFSLYGQFVLNEFLYKNLRAQNGWWANKYAWQIGLKYINLLGIRNLDVQFEHNFARPFIYTDKNDLTSFTHYQQPLAHPLQAGFKEYIYIARYQISKRCMLSATYFYMLYGKDPAGQNLGNNLLKPYTTRTKEFGNETPQGIETKATLLILQSSYMLFHNFFLDFSYQNRIETSENGNFKGNFVKLGVRWNVSSKFQEF